MTGKVLVSGASGFLALHIIGELLSQGYSVVGTVRSQSKVDKLVKQYSAKFSNPALEFVIVPDISTDNAFDDAFKTYKDIKYVLHTASPFSFGDKGSFDDVFLKPAIHGTLNILNSIKSYAPQVEKVVITSSFAAIGNTDKVGDASFIHTEDTWNPITKEEITNETQAYIASKKLAEQSAWDFYKTNDVNFKLNTITPPFIFGPQYFDEDVDVTNLNTSANVIAGLLSTDPRETSQFNQLALLAVDVRDAAKFHVIALSDKVSDERLFAVAERFSLQGILNIINAKFPELNGKIAKGQPEGEDKIPTPAFDNSKTIKLAGGYKFITLETQIVDTVKQILEVEASAASI